MLQRAARGSNRTIPEYPTPYRLDRPAGERSPLLPGDVAGMRHLLIHGSDADVHALVLQKAELLRSEGLDLLAWARASRSVDRYGVYLTPLIDACLVAGIQPSRGSYVGSEAERIAPFRSWRYCLKQVEEWLRAFGTETHVRELLTFQSRSVWLTVIEHAPHLPADMIWRAAETIGVGALEPLVRRRALARETAETLSAVAWHALVEEPSPDGELLGSNGEIAARTLALLRRCGHLPARYLRRLVESLRRGEPRPGLPHPAWALLALLHMSRVGERAAHLVAARLERDEANPELALVADFVQDHGHFQFRLLASPEFTRMKLAGTSPDEGASWDLLTHLNHHARRMKRPLGPCRGPRARAELAATIRNLLAWGEVEYATRMLIAYPELPPVPVEADLLAGALERAADRDRVVLISLMSRIVTRQAA